MSMKVSTSKSVGSTLLYIIEDVTLPNGKRTTRIVEKLGNLKTIAQKIGDQDPYEWARKRITEIEAEQEGANRDVMIPYSTSKLIPKGEKRSYNGGYLFLKEIYYQLKLDEVCKKISAKYKFEYDLNSIMSRLIYARIIYPSSKLATYRQSKDFLEGTNFESHHIYRALEVIAKETDFIQSEVYKSSMSITPRNNRILFYDCTNYYFEIEAADGDKQFGLSKQHQPSPVVGMGLFMDGDGMPLAFGMYPGNWNEQKTMTPIEKRIIRDFGLSKFVVCTDAGLSSNANRLYNNVSDRAFITTQSIKKLKKEHKKWALAAHGWKILDEEKQKLDKKEFYDISSLDEKEYKDDIFYKEKWVVEEDLSQRLIVSYSIKSRDYQRKIRENQIARAEQLISKGTAEVERKRETDFKRLIKKTAVTDDGEIAEKELFCIDTERIAKEAVYDGFYAVCTNLEDGAPDVVTINKKRWEIEECFRIMKSEFKARPVYLSRDDRIKAHFTTCFLALLVYRILEKKLGSKFTTQAIINGLRGMSFLDSRKGCGYIPSYTRSDLTDALHECSGFRTDYEIVPYSDMRNIFKQSKKG